MTHDDAEDWSINGQIMAWVLVGEVVLALIAVAYPELHHPRVLIAVATLSIVSAVLAARAQMPGRIKMGLIATVCVALLALAAAHDPFGFRAIDRRIDAATSDAGDAPMAIPSTVAPSAVATSQVSLSGKGDIAAASFADDLAHSVALKSGGEDAAYRIEGMVDVTPDSYRLTWSLGRAAEKRWCGRIVAVGQARTAALDSFSTTIVAAMRQSQGGALVCS